VGFRPFVYRLATSLGLRGQVANTVSGVVIEAEGKKEQLAEFRRRLLAETPPLSRIDDMEESELAVGIASQGFSVAESDASGVKRLLITPDSDVCDNCLAELYAPDNRRYRYPFINCTDCGPRYTIIEDLPYDRPHTAMRGFPMCGACRREYVNPADRRFHAEAVCCPDCGPRLWAADVDGRELEGEPLVLARRWLAEGKIVAIKGLGGFHLAVDATSEAAVARLRERKKRPAKPLAVMCLNAELLGRFAEASAEQLQLLKERTRPVVLLEKKAPFALADKVAPDNRFIGVMLPYTPLHYLLFEDPSILALVMTSANLSGEPIVTGNNEAIDKLAAIADGFLFHDRPILTPTDDSVLRADSGPVIYLRRARGLAPLPLALPLDCGQTLAVGADVKSTVCLSRGREAFVSQHLGDLELLATQDNFAAVVGHFMGLLQVEPELVVHDLHPGYFSSRFAAQLGLPTVAVQHHHAHAVACMAEHDLDGPVLALCLDGTGYGTDGTIWGGELLLAEYGAFRRLAHLRQVGMPGGEAAVREPWRMALSYLYACFGEVPGGFETAWSHGPQKDLLLQMLSQNINTPITSSCGRLFDAVSALTGLRIKVSFEGQAAMELEMRADSTASHLYPFSVDCSQYPMVLDTLPLVAAIVEDIKKGTPVETVSGRFHHTLAALLAEACRLARRQTALEQVVLSGGVFQNSLLTALLRRKLEEFGFTVFTHRLLPPNDACISFGQTLAGRMMQESKAGKN